MIIGITHDEQGCQIERLSVSHKVSIGLPPNGNRNYPTKTDHFIYQRKVTGQGGTVAWEVDPEMTQHFGEKCKEFWVVLHNDDIDQIFKTEYAFWKKSGKFCSGDGREAIRQTEKTPNGEPWKPCGRECPDLQQGDCKASGDLYFSLLDFPRLGSVCKLHTSGRRSIQQIYSSLSQFISTFGRLAGLKVKLAVRPEKSNYRDKDGAAKSTTIYALSLELAAEDWKKLTDGAVEPALMFERARKLLGTGTKVEYQVDEEPDDAQAPTVAAEFYPENQAPEAPAIQEPRRASETKPPEPTEAEDAVPGKGSRVITIEEIEIVSKPEKGKKPFAAIKAKGTPTPFLCFDQEQFENLKVMKGRAICIDYTDEKAGDRLFHEIKNWWQAPSEPKK